MIKVASLRQLVALHRIHEDSEGCKKEVIHSPTRKSNGHHSVHEAHDAKNTPGCTNCGGGPSKADPGGLQFKKSWWTCCSCLMSMFDGEGIWSSLFRVPAAMKFMSAHHHRELQLGGHLPW